MERTPFQQAVGFLPGELQRLVLSFAQDAEEIRLRAGQPISLVNRDGAQWIPDGRSCVISPEILRRTLETATSASYHAVVEKLCHGYISLPGGHRMGVCGEVDIRCGHIHGFRSLSSLNLRVAHQVVGAGKAASSQIFGAGIPRSVLILAPPGTGKTTLLRDLIRIASDDYSLRVSLADERGEVAALKNGIPQLNVGRYTDVLDGCPKAEGMMLLLRSMNPQLLAVDEVTSPEDIDALSVAANCGVSVFATAHGSTIGELRRRPLYQRLLSECIFELVLIIQHRGAQRSMVVEKLGG